MSVKVSRREEKRDTSLRDFILVATLPLLLFGLIGFFIGQADKIDAGVIGNDLSTLTQRAEKAEAIHQEMLLLGHQTDSLLQLVLDGAKVLDDEWLQAVNKQVVPGFGMNPLSEWLEKVNQTHRRLSRGIAEVKGYAQGNEIFTTTQIDYFTLPVALLNDKYKDAFYYQLNSYSGQNSTGQENTERLSEQKEDFEGQIDILHQQLALKEEIIRAKEARIAEISNTPAGQAPPPISYATQKGNVKNAVNQIRGAIGRIPDGLFSNNRKREELETEISGQLISIETAIETIN